MRKRPHVVEIIQPSSSFRSALTFGRHKGINALGVLELAVVLAPLLLGIWSTTDATAPTAPEGITPLQRVLFPLCAFVTAVFDWCWRLRNEPDPRWWVKLTSADAGGALLWLPGWLFCLVAAAIGTFALLFVHVGPSPYAL